MSQEGGGLGGFSGWGEGGRGGVTHLTVVGRVRLTRRVWWGAPEGTASPADEWLNDGAARVSPGAREMCCRLGCHPQGFRHSAADLKRLAGLSISPERMRQIVGGESPRGRGGQDAR